MDTKKNLKYYLGLNWSYTIEQDTHNGKKFYIIRVNELPGVCTDATSIEKGMKNIKEAIAATIELYLEQGDFIPEPVNKEEFKGNISYRTTSERHYYLARLAQEKHVSMNKALDMIFDAGLQQFRTHL
ncbi:MAG TPA: type II toxin-antitoxin system HicB family antitoxin [Rhabdochlamydiaceae bacterium]|nr:type II toxin-antitoxin system HicB family antitoxin [Rhabdochlamydiaceae bacterium]